MKKGFNAVSSGIVTPDWIDRNGHMNACYYMSIFNGGTDSILRRIGISDYSVKTKGLTFVASRIYISHRKELLCDENWQLTSGFLTINPRYLTIVHKLTSARTVKAYCYIRGAIFCMKKRQARFLEPKLASKARALIIDGLKDPFDSII